MSNIFGLKTMGAKIMLCGPSHLIPKYISDFGVKISHNIDQALEWGDVINILRIQRERMGIGVIPSIREYRNLFGITKPANYIRNNYRIYCKKFIKWRIIFF